MDKYLKKIIADHKAELKELNSAIKQRDTLIAAQNRTIGKQSDMIADKAFEIENLKGLIPKDVKDVGK